MAGKRISLRTSEEAARRIEYISRVEQRSRSRIAGAALEFYLRLPGEAHTALRHVQALGTDEELNRVLHAISIVLIDAQYDIAARRMGEALRERGIEVPETEEELLDEAIRLTEMRAEPIP